jgi:flagellum-specific peptidoglycan hydrolase FlgJ
MPVGLVILLGIFLFFLSTRRRGEPLTEIRQVIRASEFASYEPYIINQMNLESGYLTNTLSQPPIYNPFAMGRVRIRPTTQIDYYSNPNIDGGQDFGVYTGYASATEDFILYLNYIRMPQGLTCQEYNEYIASKGYAVDPRYAEYLNNMCK